MTGEDLFLKLLDSINSKFGLNDPDLDDLIKLDEDLENSIAWLQTLAVPTHIQTFLQSLENLRVKNEGNFLSTPYSNIGSTEIIDLNQPKFQNKNRGFGQIDSDFSFISSKVFFKGSDMIDFSRDENIILWRIVEEFLERIYSSMDTAKIDQFFNLLGVLDRNKGLIINKTGLAFNEDHHYPFIYLSYLNNSKSILLETDLKYSPGQLYSTLTFDNTKNYAQYFDIYDVINELNQAPDILNRYLRLYHILEYLVYRVYLVKLVSGLGGSKLFVREFITLADNVVKYERSSFIKNFTIIFQSDLAPDIQPNLAPMVSQPVIDFLKDHNIVKGFTNTDIKKIAEFIYGIRCCIVHNKESEYHMTISNSDDYFVIIPLLKKTLETFERLIVQKIADNDATINYPSKSVDLY